MEKKNEKILRYLLGVSEESRYVVVKVADVLARLHMPDSEQNRDAVVAAVKQFVDGEYIGCKYYDRENICCVSMARGRMWAQNSETPDRKKKFDWRFLVAVFAVVLVAAFFGSWLGGLV